MEKVKVLQEALRPYVLVRVEVRLGEENLLADRFHVGVVPTMIVLDGQDREIDRVPGYRSPLAMADRLRKIRGGQTVSRLMARYRAEKKHSRNGVEWCLKTLLRRGRYGEAVVEAERNGPEMLTVKMRERIFRARLEAFSALYWDAADGARKAGWQRLELPPDPAGVAGPALVGLVVAGQRGRGPEGEALRLALREARRADAGRYARSLLARVEKRERRRQLLEFAARNGCRDAVTLLARGLTWAGLDEVSGTELKELVGALVRTDGDPELADRLADRLLQAEPGVMALAMAARARYMAGRRSVALREIEEAQRSAVGRGALLAAHNFGRERRSMAAGRWTPPPVWIDSWPEP